MSDPRYGTPRYKSNRDIDSQWRPADGTGHETAWLLVALAVMVAGAIAWFGIAPPQNNQETAATRIPVTTDLDTTGQSGPRP